MNQTDVMRILFLPIACLVYAYGRVKLFVGLGNKHTLFENTKMKLRTQQIHRSRTVLHIHILN